MFKFRESRPFGVGGTDLEGIFFLDQFFYTKNVPFFHYFLNQTFCFVAPQFRFFYTMFLHQILKFRKLFFGKNWCKKTQNWSKKQNINNVKTQQICVKNKKLV